MVSPKDRGKPQQPPQHQERQPGREGEMRPRPEDEMKGYRAAGKLRDKVAIITGGDSGIGRAVSVGFAKEGAHVVVGYLEEGEDGERTRQLVEAEGRTCMLVKGDVGEAGFCHDMVERAVREFGRLDILVNNAGEQHPVESLRELTDEQLHRTFKTNIFAYFYMAREALKHLREGGTIINTTSVTAYEGHPQLLDYAATKGAIVAFTRSLAVNLASKGIRVNGVAPGETWTPLIPASFKEEKVAHFGSSSPMGRVGQPDEVAPCYIFLASDDSSFMTGQILHPNGGRIVNG